MKWVTRERPKIDRIACPWLILCFVERDVEFLYVPGGDALKEARAITHRGQPGHERFSIAAASILLRTGARLRPVVTIGARGFAGLASPWHAPVRRMRSFREIGQQLRRVRSAWPKQPTRAQTAAARRSAMKRATSSAGSGREK